jgi:ribosomal peptide maturation radical SAM protein 1
VDLEKITSFFPARPERRLLLLVSPLVWTAAPLGGIHQLQAFCRQEDINTTVFYSNLLYSRLVGRDLHQAIVMEDAVLLAERLFAASAFGLPPMGLRFEHNLSLLESSYPDGRFRGVDWLDLEGRTRDWVHTLGRWIADSGFPIVGCSTTHGGLAPAVALLKVVKRLAPFIVTVIGGALCEGEMAEGILSLDSPIDVVFSGEGDQDFPNLANRYLRGERPEEAIHVGRVLPDLDTAPLPDYDDFFALKDLVPDEGPATSIAAEELSIPYETSRGCWYARCAFCGLMGETNLYRWKSPDRIIGDLAELTARFPAEGSPALLMTDNIIPPAYFKGLFPRMPEELPPLKLLYEVKSNLVPRQLEILSRAGVSFIQAGIESLSESLLRRMDKGVEVWENIDLLRFARGLNIDVKWNLLYGFPGDQAADYEEMARLLPLIHHLQPPHLLIPLRLCRNSRYHKEPEAAGISNFSPAGAHRDVLPTHADVDKLAIHFTGDYASGSLDTPEVIDRLRREFTAWKNKWAFYHSIPIESLLPELKLSPADDGGDYLLTDTRGIEGLPRQLVLNAKQADVVLRAGPLDGSPLQAWALESSLAVESASWFVPLVTAPLSLLLDKGSVFPA